MSIAADIIEAEEPPDLEKISNELAETILSGIAPGSKKRA